MNFLHRFYKAQLQYSIRNSGYYRVVQNIFKSHLISVNYSLIFPSNMSAKEAIECSRLVFNIYNIMITYIIML